LHLKSSFKDFFERKVLDNKDFNHNYNNLLFYLIYLRFYYPGKASKTLFKMVYEDNPNWMDIESFIKIIATNTRIMDGILKSMSYRNPNVAPPMGEDIFIVLIGRFLNKLNLPKSNYDRNTIESLLNDNLLEFEQMFSEYIKTEIDLHPEYQAERTNFINQILKSSGCISDYCDLQILNFNYTSSGNNDLNEANVHGDLNNKVVMGYDSTDLIVHDEHVIQLSKEWRKMDVPFEYPDDTHQIADIIVYGHSLGEQDYPYFFEIFDKADFLSNKCRVRFILCYSDYGDEKTQRNALEKYKINASKLLNAYERYKIPNITRNTIVTSLLLSNPKRLLFIKI